MSRRAQYMYGAILPPGEKSLVDAGLGRTVSVGNVTLIAPTDHDRQGGRPARRRRRGDGVPAHAGHRSAVRDEHLLPAIPDAQRRGERHAQHAQPVHAAGRGDPRRDRVVRLTSRRRANSSPTKSDVMIAQHHWPKWGQANIDDMLRKHRDLYKYIHDQTVRLMNQGYTPREIAAQLKLPPSLDNEWSTRGYYGTLSHNTKAVYQKYLGWYDANPANLDPLPPAESAQRYVEYMGGANARSSSGHARISRTATIRWVAEVDEPARVRGSVEHGSASARSRRDGAARLPERVGRLAQRVPDWPHWSCAAASRSCQRSPRRAPTSSARSRWACSSITWRAPRPAQRLKASKW